MIGQHSLGAHSLVEMEAAIGVIGLSIQVIDTSVKVKRVIDNYRTVSKDIRRLAIKIDRAETICRAIKTHLNDGSTRSNSAALIQQLGPQVLTEISATLTELERVVSEIEAKAGKKGGAKLLGVSFLKRKDTIQKLGQELDEDLIFLQSLMNTEVFSRVEAIHHKLEIAPISQPRHDQDITQSDRFQASLEPLSTAQTIITKPKPKPKPEPKTQVRHRTSTQRKRWACRFFTSVNCSKNTREVTSGISISNERTAFSIGHELLSYRIELVWGFGTFTSAWCSLRFPRDVEMADARTLLDIFSANDAVGFQRLLTSGEISLETTVEESSLFHLAWMFRGSEICRFLLQQSSNDYLEGSPTSTLIELYGSKGGHLRYGVKGLEHPQNTRDMLALTQTWMPIRITSSVVADFRFTSCLARTPKQLEMCFDHFQPYAEYEMEDLTECAWEVAVRLFCKEVYMATKPETDLDDWKRLLGKILAGGSVDVHRLIPDPHSKGKECSAILCLLHQHACPETLYPHLRIWLGTLGACNVQLQPYLEREYSYCQENFDPDRIQTFWFQDGFGIEFCQEKVLGFAAPFWRFKDNNTTPVYDLLHEFPHLRLICPGFRVQEPVFDQISSLCKESQVRAWKRAGYSDDNWVWQWPFFWSLYMCEEEPSPYYVCEMRERDILSSFYAAAEISKQRFERRWRKKFLKSTKGAVMPGSWVDN